MSLPTELESLRERARHLNDGVLLRQQLSPAGSLLSAGVGNGGGTSSGEAAAVAAALLMEYDALTVDLQRKVDFRADEVRTLSMEVRRLIGENERMARDLRAAVELQMNALDPEAVRSAETDNDALELLRTQLQLAAQERDSSDELSRLARQEVERLEAELAQLRRSNVSPEQWNELQLHTEQLKREYVTAMRELHSELRAASENLRKSKMETKLAEAQAEDFRKLLEQARHKAEQVDQEKLTGLEVDLAAARRHLVDLESRLAGSLKLCEEVKKEKVALEVKVVQAQKQSAEHEQRAFEAASKVKDTLLMVESALLEKDQVALRERQQEEEIERLREELSGLVHAAGLRTKQEVQKLWAVYNAKLARLLEDVHALEMENGERKAQLERAVREKRAVESELEKVYREGVAASMKDGGKYDQLNTRACEAERQRDEAAVKLDSVQGALKRTEAMLAREKTKWSSEAARLTERIEELTRDVERIDADRLRLSAELDETAKKLLACRQEKEAAERAIQRQLYSSEQEAARQQKEFEVKLRSADDAHRQSVEQLRQLVLSHQRTASKWKNEFEETQVKSERELSEHRAQATDLKRRIDELRALLSEARDKTAESEKTMAECAAQIRKMESRVREADARAAEALKQSAVKEAKLRRLMQQIGDGCIQSTRPAPSATSLRTDRDSDRYQRALTLDDLDAGYAEPTLKERPLSEYNRGITRPEKPRSEAQQIDGDGRDGAKENVSDSRDSLNSFSDS